MESARSRDAECADRCRASGAWLAMFAVAFMVPTTGQCLTWDYVPTAVFGVLYEVNPQGALDSSQSDNSYAGSIGAGLNVSAETETAFSHFNRDSIALHMLESPMPAT